MITIINPVNTHHHTVTIFFLVVRTVRATLLVTFSYAAQYYEL